MMSAHLSLPINLLLQKQDDLRRSLAWGLTGEHIQLIETSLANLEQDYQTPLQSPTYSFHWKDLATALLWVTDVLRNTGHISRNLSHFTTFAMFKNPNTIELSDHRDALVARTIALYGSRTSKIGRNFYIDERIVDIMYENDLDLLRNTLCHRYELAASAVNLHGEGSYNPVEHWNWLVLHFKPLWGSLDTQLRTILACMRETVAWEIGNWPRYVLAEQRRQLRQQEAADSYYEDNWDDDYSDGYDEDYDSYEDEDSGYYGNAY